MTKAQARKRLKEAGRKVFAVLAADYGNNSLTPNQVKALFDVHKALRRLEDQIK